MASFILLFYPVGSGNPFKDIGQLFFVFCDLKSTKRKIQSVEIALNYWKEYADKVQKGIIINQECFSSYFILVSINKETPLAKKPKKIKKTKPLNS